MRVPDQYAKTSARSTTRWTAWLTMPPCRCNISFRLKGMKALWFVDTVCSLLGGEPGRDITRCEEFSRLSQMSSRGFPGHPPGLMNGSRTTPVIPCGESVSKDDQCNSASHGSQLRSFSYHVRISSCLQDIRCPETSTAESLTWSQDPLSQDISQHLAIPVESSILGGSSLMLPCTSWLMWDLVSILFPSLVWLSSTGPREPEHIKRELRLPPHTHEPHVKSFSFLKMKPVSTRFDVLGALGDPVELWDTFKRETLQATKECIGERPRSRRGLVSTEDAGENRGESRCQAGWEPGPAQGSVTPD
ncbi:hypothetical protein GWK47_031678 [Chionoecetes opilio]|uniref:Uncharacterized protein n=1 Tax=Chionoecetes opilio TaxID=41210 RepID=A0A8J5D211_CHIOP|nr:hypothetical protein GWK47_031678 [Chionoecetes opilio]